MSSSRYFYPGGGGRKRKLRKGGTKINEPKPKTKPRMDLEKRIRLQAGGIRCATMNWLKDHPDAWPGLYAALVREAEER